MSNIIKPEEKHTNAPPADKGFLSFNELLKETADSGKGGIVEDPFKVREEIHMARRRSEAIIEEAQIEAERLKEEGFQKGILEGRAETAKETASMMEQYRDVLGQIQEQRALLHRQCQEDSLVLIKAMAERLVNHEITVNPRVIQSTLQKAMEFVVEQSEVRVRLHPEDFQRIKVAGLEDPAMLEGTSQVHLIEDPTVSMGGCYLESSFGEIDATLENCRGRLMTALDEAFQAALTAEQDAGKNT